MSRVMSAGVVTIIAIAAILHGNAMVPCPDTCQVPSQGFRININFAGQRELELLPGIGPVMAARIIDWRLQGHLIEDAVQLQAIHGVGPRTIENIRPWVTP